ncbi:endothelin-converting enzyme 1-like [Xenia sp. Carnegie-2017]|uniref:endothelin-converting enzyme 1-like n=1 Tax=Xenia sp. Carnegie-2017 TaxID=2897299 RepID=UPI001F043175|nr:endothelin-converting enzyme 1-like [Xenia sp. Carnegie-2017]
MSLGGFIFIVLLWWKVTNSSASVYNSKLVENDYPYNIKDNSASHQYDIDDPESSRNAREKSFPEISQTKLKNDNVDYGTYEQTSRYQQREYERGYSSWLLRTYDDSSEDKNTCKTKDCQTVANEIRNSIDMSVHPCEDFDKFACGGWRSLNPIPESQSQWTQFTKLWKHEETLLRDLIQRQENSSANTTSSLIFAWYTSCLNETERKRNGDKTLLKLIAELGSCPILTRSSWCAQNWSFVNRLVQLNQISIHPFFLLMPRDNLVNSSQILLTLSPSKLLLESENFYLGKGSYHSSVFKAYTKLMIELILKLRGSLRFHDIASLLNFRNQIANMLRLEIFMAKIWKSTSKFVYAIISLNRLQREIPWFPWKYYILRLYSGINLAKPITGDEMIAIYKLDAIKKIAWLLKYTPKSVKSNFLIWNAIFSFTGVIGPDYENVRHQFIVAMYGNQKRKERWRECVSSTSAALPMALGKLFVKEKFDENSQKAADRIIEGIRQQLIKDFNDISWMDEITTKKAKEKAEAIVKNIGYPQYVLNETLLSKKYDGMSFNGMFLVNILQRRKIISRNTLKLREKEADRKRWSMSPQEINAYYSPQYNKIVFPAGVLQPPFWQASFPMSMQFGGLGFIAGHEISHGFDVTGMHYDKYGNFIAWGTNSTSKAFMEKSTCLSKQYSNYTIFGKHINGIKTLSENIADNGGIRLAYKAYEEWKNKTGLRDTLLPGLRFTSDQLFFLKGAQIWCANVRKKSTLNMIDIDPHTPKIFRIIGPFSNFEKFSEAFNCSLGSRMNPEKKCRVW